MCLQLFYLKHEKLPLLQVTSKIEVDVYRIVSVCNDRREIHNFGLTVVAPPSSATEAALI